MTKTSFAVSIIRKPSAWSGPGPAVAASLSSTIPFAAGYPGRRIGSPVRRANRQRESTATTLRSQVRSASATSWVMKPRRFFGTAFASLMFGAQSADPYATQPLAVCDARSVASDDLVAAALVYRDRTGENYLLTYRPSHRWFYVPEMRGDEALLLKCYDSAQAGRARLVPHTAFTDPTAPADVLLRESIELRTLVFGSG